MKNEHPFSDEHPNAYIDNQLDLEEAGQVLRKLQENPALNQSFPVERRWEALFLLTSLIVLQGLPGGKPYTVNKAAGLLSEWISRSQVIPKGIRVIGVLAVQ